MVQLMQHDIVEYAVGREVARAATSTQQPSDYSGADIVVHLLRNQENIWAKRRKQARVSYVWVRIESRSGQAYDAKVSGEQLAHVLGVPDVWVIKSKEKIAAAEK